MTLHYRALKILIVSILFLMGGLYIALTFSAPVSWQEQTIEISSGSSLVSIAKLLEEKGVVRSQVAFQSAVMMLGKEKSVKSGFYYFSQPLSSLAVARRFLSGDYDIQPIKIRIPEGATLSDISVIGEIYLTNFNKEEFLIKTEEKEGYLFPDTYFFFPDTDTDMLIKTMEDNFEKQIESLSIPLNSKYSLSEYITLASIIEKEATIDEKERAIVSGILHNRLDKNMLLQVDATLKYTLGKGSSELRTDDLKSDFPFNTYVHKGLPPHPIGSPGLSSISAAMYPESTPFLFYLHDSTAQIYYARTHDEHVSNKRKYLK